MEESLCSENETKPHPSVKHMKGTITKSLIALAFLLLCAGFIVCVKAQPSMDFPSPGCTYPSQYWGDNYKDCPRYLDSTYHRGFCGRKPYEWFEMNYSIGEASLPLRIEYLTTVMNLDCSDDENQSKILQTIIDLVYTLLKQDHCKGPVDAETSKGQFFVNLTAYLRSYNEGRDMSPLCDDYSLPPDNSIQNSEQNTPKQKGMIEIAPWQLYVLFAVGAVGVVALIAATAYAGRRFVKSSHMKEIYDSFNGMAHRGEEESLLDTENQKESNIISDDDEYTF